MARTQTQNHIDEISGGANNQILVGPGNKIIFSAPECCLWTLEGLIDLTRHPLGALNP